MSVELFGFVVGSLIFIMCLNVFMIKKWRDEIADKEKARNDILFEHKRLLKTLDAAFEKARCDVGLV